MIVDNNKKWQAVAVAILKNEENYIENWLLFHLSIGFQHVFIYDNNSCDGVKEILEKYICGGVVTYINWPVRAGQIDAYNHALFLLRHNTDWIGFFDIDEYIVLHEHDSIISYVSSLDADQILLPWRNFAYGGHKFAPGGSDIENYFWAHNVATNGSVQVKHLVRAEVAKSVTAHFSFISTKKTLLADKSPSDITHIIANPTYKGAQINHYFTRSFAENSKRIQKGQVDGGTEKKLADFSPLTADSVPYLNYDASILRHLQKFFRERERWSYVAKNPHRFGLMQKTNALTSWNNAPFFFCKSFLNFLDAAPEIRHGTNINPVYVNNQGVGVDLRTFWHSSNVTSIHFRVDKQNFIPYFMGSVHYGDFARRFGFQARIIERKLPIMDDWTISLNGVGWCLGAIFDMDSENGVTIVVNLGTYTVLSYSVPPGRHAGFIYHPEYFLDNIAVQISIFGCCQVNELIIGVLP